MPLKSPGTKIKRSPLSGLFRFPNKFGKSQPSSRKSSASSFTNDGNDENSSYSNTSSATSVSPMFEVFDLPRETPQENRIPPNIASNEEAPSKYPLTLPIESTIMTRRSHGRRVDKKCFK